MNAAKVTTSARILGSVELLIVLTFSCLTAAQVGHCTSCKSDITVKGCFGCVAVSGYGYCSCSVKGACPQVVTECGDCQDPFQVRLNCSDCCPACSCVNVSRLKTTAWVHDKSIPERLRSFSPTVALAVEELQTNTPSCKSRHPIIKVLDQDDHSTVIKFDTYISEAGNLELEGNGEKFLASGDRWMLRRNGVEIVSDDVYKDK